VGVLRSEFVADAVDGEEVFGGVAVVAEFFSQLDDDLIQGASGAVIILAPDFVEEAVAREDLAGVSVKELEEFQFARGEFLNVFTAAHLEGFWVDGGFADFKGGDVVVPIGWN